MFAYVFILIIVICKINILQGSVATQLKCGRVVSNRVFANFSLNVPVKEL